MLVRSSRELLGGLADVVAGSRLTFQSRSAVLLVLWLLHQVPLVVGTGASDPGGAERARASLLFQIVEVAVLIARSQKACLLLALVRRIAQHSELPGRQVFVLAITLVLQRSLVRVS